MFFLKDEAFVKKFFANLRIPGLAVKVCCHYIIDFLALAKFFSRKKFEYSSLGSLLYREKRKIDKVRINVWLFRKEHNNSINEFRKKSFYNLKNE